MANNSYVRPAILAPAAIALAAAATVGLGIAASGPEMAAVVPGALGALAVLTNPILGVFGVAVTIPVEALTMISGATLGRLLGMLLAFAWLLHRLVKREPWKPLLESGLFVGGILFLVFAASSRLWATYPDAYTLGLVRLAQLFVFGIIVADLVRTWERAGWVAKLLVVGATIAAAVTVYQALGTGVRRAGGGVGGGINATALVMVSLVPFSFYLIRASERLLWRLLGVGCLGLTIIAVALTLSRMSMLLLPVVMLAGLYETLRSGRGVVPLVAATALGVFLLFQFGPMDSFQERVSTIEPYLEQTLEPEDRGLVEMSARGHHMKTALAIFADHPIIGAGYRNYNHLFLRYQFQVPGAPRLRWVPQSPHSSYLGILADLGLVGISLWVGLLGYAMYCLVSAWRRLSDRRGSRQFLLVQAITFSFGVQLIYGFYDVLQVEKMTWLLLGLAVAVRWMVESGEEGQDERQEDGTRAPEEIPSTTRRPSRVLAGSEAQAPG